MNIGDKVQWVPSIEHHLEVKDGKYAWEHAIKSRDKLEVQTMDEIRLFLKRNAKHAEALKNLIATKPQCTYSATVTAGEGDKVGLDIVSPIGGVTLHYDNVPIDASGAPGTCH